MPELKAFYFTFGCGFPLSEHVQVVMAPNEAVARAGMFRYYADRWCACYPSDQVQKAEGGRVEIGKYWKYTPLAKIITAYDESSIGCCRGC